MANRTPEISMSTENKNNTRLAAMLDGERYLGHANSLAELFRNIEQAGIDVTQMHSLVILPERAA